MFKLPSRWKAGDVSDPPGQRVPVPVWNRHHCRGWRRDLPPSVMLIARRPRGPGPQVLTHLHSHNYSHTNIHTHSLFHTSTHTHPQTLISTLTHTLSLTHALTYTNTRALTHALTITHTHSYTHIHRYHTRTHLLSRTLIYPHSHTHSYTYTLTLTYTFHMLAHLSTCTLTLTHIRTH